MTPGRADRRVVDRHLIALRQAVATLRRHAGISPESLRADSDRRWAIECGLQLCAQNALDIASHIASTLGLDPATYSSSIDSLVEANVLRRSFGERFRGVAGFRNVLVHGYLDVDLALICTMLGDSLDDFEEFAGHVERWLAQIVESESNHPRLSVAETMSVLAVGVDGCAAGWFFVALAPSGTSRWGIVRDLGELVQGELVQHAREPVRIFVDIPIGLPDGPGGRECDRVARRNLVPVRAVCSRRRRESCSTRSTTRTPSAAATGGDRQNTQQTGVRHCP